MYTTNTKHIRITNNGICLIIFNNDNDLPGKNILYRIRIKWQITAKAATQEAI